MSALDASLDALAFFRTWKGTFLAALEASERGARAAADAVARAERVVGPLAPASSPAEPPSQADALARLEAEVALLDAFEGARARREVWLGWIARATPGGPLAAWRAEAEARRDDLERRLAEADPDGLLEVRAELERQLAALDTLAEVARDRLGDARAQARHAVDTFDQAVRILAEDVRRMDDELEAVRTAGASVDHDGVGPLVGMGLVAGAVAGAVGWFGGGANAVLWAAGAGGGALVIGLGAGLWRWGRALGDVQTRLAALDRQARDLAADLTGARATVLTELATATAAFELAARDAAELRLDPGRLDNAQAIVRVNDPGVSLPLDGLRARIATVRVSDRRWRGAAAGIGAVGLLVALGVLLVARAPTTETVAEAPVPLPTVSPAPPVDGAVPTAGASATPSGEVAADPAPPGPPPTPTAPPRPGAAGAWGGPLGLATVDGTLAQDGARLTGTLTLTEADGAPRTCRVKGTASSGDKIRVTLQGCGAPVRLEGAIRDGGRTLRGKARSTGTGAFAGAEVVDAFELTAR